MINILTINLSCIKAYSEVADCWMSNIPVLSALCLSCKVINGGTRIGEIWSHFYLLFGTMPCPRRGAASKLQFAYQCPWQGCTVGLCARLPWAGGALGVPVPPCPPGPNGAPTQQLLKSCVLTEAGSRSFSLFSADTPVLSVGLVSASSFLRWVVRNSESTSVALIKEKKEMADNAGNFL